MGTLPDTVTFGDLKEGAESKNELFQKINLFYRRKRL